jgi:hypothetical protein
MLHVTNGESVSISRTGLGGPVVCWNDILHDGPVPAGLPLQELSRVRERFIADFLAIPLAEVSFAGRDEAISHFRDHEEVVLWFEHDLFDQLQLIQVLDWFSRQDPASTRMSLISADTYLGPMSPAQLVPLFETRHAITTAEFKTAQAAWTAFCSPEPTGLRELLDSDTSALPFLRGALLRHLQQFPALRSGVSRSERQILELVRSGVHQFRYLFPAAQKLEESIWMGDSTFQRYLRGLAQARQPLIRPQNGGFEINALGRLVLDGEEDHVRVNGIDRWLGGVHLHEVGTVWRWDETSRTVQP